MPGRSEAKLFSENGEFYWRRRVIVLQRRAENHPSAKGFLPRIAVGAGVPESGGHGLSNGLLGAFQLRGATEKFPKTSWFLMSPR